MLCAACERSVNGRLEPCIFATQAFGSALVARAKLLCFLLADSSAGEASRLLGCFVCQIRQLASFLVNAPVLRFQALRLAASLWHIAQRIAQRVADGMDLGVQTPARDADGLGAGFLLSTRRGLMRLAAGRVDHDFFQIRLLYTQKKSLEMPLFAPVGIALVHHVPFAKSLWKVSPR